MAQDEQVFKSMQDPEWINKTRTLLVSSKGITSAQRQFILSIFGLLPHSKKQYKLQKDDVKGQIEQLCETHKTRYFIYFDCRKKVNFSLWLGRYPEGPSIKFGLDGIVHSRDIKFQGNSVKGARHILSFDSGMQTSPKMRIARQLIIGAFNIPKYHPKSTAVIDHVLNFTGNNDEIKFKNYQIFREDVSKTEKKVDFYEIGPRFIMNTICILDGVLGGEVLYRAPVIKKYLKKSKTDPRKLLAQNRVPTKKNIFGEQEQVIDE